jgi:glycosyltransferase involved in cell wall biosynthesis
MSTLFLFTGSYPYSVAAENTFIPQELAVLSEHFERIVVVPSSIEGDCETIDLPNVSVNIDFATTARSTREKWVQLMTSLTDAELLEECISNASLFVRHPALFRRALGYHVRAKMAESWIRRLNATLRLTVADSVICTWWFDTQTLGLARFGSKNAVPVVTRAHGYDLYETRHSPPYIPFRRSALTHVDRVYPDSNAGARYLTARYPAFAPKIEAALLGVEDPGFLNKPSSDGVFRIVSCSFLTPVKRIDLLIRGLGELGRDFPDQIVEWTHLGDGPGRAALSAQARATLPPNVRWELNGYPGKGQVYEHYRTRPVDLFANVSQSEGTPVSIMEAISVGIPVLCTTVGGNIEVVGAENGLLIGANPSSTVISAGIMSLIKDPGGLCNRRAGSRARWEDRYNARKNYSAFAESLRAEGRGQDWIRNSVT